MIPPGNERDDDAAFAACREDWTLAPGKGRAWLKVAGPDAEEFLQRLLTSDILALEIGAGQWSALLDRKGRWVADLLAFRCGESSFGLDHPAIRSTALLEALDRSHFAENLAWELEEWERTLILGPKGGDALAEIGLNPPPSSGGCSIVRLDDDRWLIHRPDKGAPCLELFSPGNGPENFLAELRGRASAPAGKPVLETLRVAAFLPRFGREFSAETILPETGDWRRTSMTKGCYVGQEVVARIRTYGQAPWRICSLQFSGQPPEKGAPLLDEAGNEVGKVTSSCLPPGKKNALGMGRIRRKAAEDGNRILAVLGGQSIPVAAKPLSRD